MSIFLDKVKIIFLLTIVAFMMPQHANGDEQVVSISGKVKNKQNNKTLSNVSLSVPGTNIATVTNADGFFNLKIPKKVFKNGIKAEHVGFKSSMMSGKELLSNRGDLVFYLEPTGKVLKEVVIYGGEPKRIVEEAIRKIPLNYSDIDNLFSGFYRETVRKGSRFISISEAMVDVLKKPYKNRNINGEKVRIHKGRKLLSQNPSDTLAVKLAGGPYMPIMLDIVKNGDQLFTSDEIDYFDFKMEEPVMIDDRMHFAISFKPNVKFSYPLNKGKLFIDGETLSISRAEFELDMSDRNKVTRSILQKKPSGLHFKPQEVSGVVTYKLVDGKSYLNYISSTIKFKCDWKKRLFSSGYTTHSEMVMVDRDDNPDRHLKFSDSFGKRNIFSDVVENYWEEDFWKDYNIIEPTESLEKAVGKLKK